MTLWLIFDALALDRVVTLPNHVDRHAWLDAPFDARIF